MASPLRIPTARENAFRRLLDAFRAELTADGARAYVEALADYPDERLIAGVQRAIRECPTFPSVATLREQCRLATPAVETAKLLAPPVDERDPRNWFVCQICHDSGWTFERIPHPAGYEVDAARKCVCFMTNPRVRLQAGVGAK